MMAKEQLLAKNLTTVFTVSVLIFPIIFYFYAVTTEWQKIAAFLVQADFIVCVLTGILGTYKNILINNKIQDDVELKLKAMGSEVERMSYNQFKINKEPKLYAINLNSVPSDTIEVDSDKKLISYK